MRFQLYTLIIASLIVTGCKQTDERIIINQDYTSTEALLQWFDQGMPDSSVNTIAQLAGMQIMESNLLKQNKITEPRFASELLRFNTDSLVNDIYNIWRAYKHRISTKKLMHELQRNSFSDSTVAYALNFMPEGFIPLTHINIYYVPTGWEWGDAYVRGIECNKNSYSVSSYGKPAIIINLSKVSESYGKYLHEQVFSLNGVMAHEIFHLFFREYKQRSRTYKNHKDTSYQGQLLELIHNEGIAHYISEKKTMHRYYFQLQEYEIQSFATLNKAIEDINDPSIPLETKKQLVYMANTGKYWNKFGSISGMFMAYHIDTELGINELVKTIKENSFIETYMKLCESKPSLPKLTALME